MATEAKAAEQMSSKVAYTVREVCDLLSLGKDAVYRGLAEGRIPRCAGLGRTKRIPAWWVEECLAGTRGEPVEPPPPLLDTTPRCR